MSIEKYIVLVLVVEKMSLAQLFKTNDVVS